MMDGWMGRGGGEEKVTRGWRRRREAAMINPDQPVR